jgi:molybdate transport system substrate-binding protein
MNLFPQTALKVLSGGAVQRGLVSLAKAFEDETSHKIIFAFATAPVLRRRLARDEGAFDIVVAPLPLMKEVEPTGFIIAGSSAVIGGVRAGVVVRENSSEPDISSAEALKKEILASRSLVYNEGSSGIFVEKLLERLGVAEQAKAKTTRVPDAEAVIRHLASSTVEKEIGFGQITAILAHFGRGVKLVGPLPKEVENVTVYAAAVSAKTNAPEVAAQFIRFLVTPSAKEAFKATGVE